MAEVVYIFPKQTALFKHLKKNRSSGINTGGGFLFESGNRKPFPPPRVVRYTHNGSLLTDARNNSDGAAATTAETEQQ